MSTEQLLALGIIMLLAVVGVLGDLCLKEAGRGRRMDPIWFVAGSVAYGVTIGGWYYVFRHIKLATVGGVYAITTTLLLVAVGTLYFREQINRQECAGVVLAVCALLLLVRHA